MQFRRVNTVNGMSLDISLSSNISYSNGIYEIHGIGEILDTCENPGIRLSGAGNWIANPSLIQDSAEVEIFGENPDSQITLTAIPHNRASESDAITEITFPSLSLLKAAAVCIETDLPKIPSQITKLSHDEATSVWRFLAHISDVVHYEDYLIIVESLSEISPAFRFELSQQVGDQIKRMLVGWESNAEFRITSYDDLQTRIDDFENLSTVKKLPQSIEEEQVLSSALSEVASEGTIDDVIELCRALDLPKHYPGLLRDHQARSIMAQNLIEGNLTEAWRVAQATLDFEFTGRNKSYDQLADAAMEESDQAKKAEIWGASILAASGDYETDSAIANYLYWTARTTKGHQNVCARLYKAAYHGFRRCEITHMAQYAKYNHFAQLGYKHRQMKEHGLAADQFLEAYTVASNTSREFDHRQFSQCITATRNWATACADNFRYQGEYMTGIHVLETASQSIRKFSTEINDDNRIDQSLQLLRAKRRILEMEQYLTQAEYELALETAGNIIGIYAKLDEQESQKWAITKRKEIQAIVYETNGDLSKAADLHRDIGENGYISDQRQHWHIHRGDICEAKKLAIEGAYHDAKAQLLEIQTRTNRLKSEANDLAVVLDAVLDYQQGKQTPFQRSVQKLSEPNVQNHRVPPMRVEYDYEEPLSVIHAAQWLRSYNVDEELLSMAVEVALLASLIPLHAGEAAATIGIDEVDLRDQWVNQLPSPVAQRIKQIELDKAVPQTDYVGLASRLFNLVELYLAIFGEYFATRKWGTEWRPELSDDGKTEKMPLGDLANVFTRCSENISSSAAANELVNGSGNTPSVTKLRNDIGHIKTDNVNTIQFDRFYDRVMTIFRTTADDVPVIGKKVETRGEGAFQRELVQLQWWRSLRLAYIQTDKQLTDGKLYYFPQDPIAEAGEQASVNIPSDEIVPVSTDRVVNKF